MNQSGSIALSFANQNVQCIVSKSPEATYPALILKKKKKKNFLSQTKGIDIFFVYKLATVMRKDVMAVISIRGDLGRPKEMLPVG